jgi:hypothetical protein
MVSARNRQRRVANRTGKDRVTRESAQWLAGQQARPEVQAIRAAQAEDAGMVARVSADLPGQALRLGRSGWLNTTEGVDGAGCWDLPPARHRPYITRILHSVDRYSDGLLWGHTSVSRSDRILPGWEEVRDAHWLLYPGVYGVVVVAPREQHVNLREVAHVWACLDGPTVPDFTHGLGVI